MNSRGFTLIEMLIVVAIIGILAGIAIPGYVGMQKKAARSEAYSNLQNLRLLQEQFFADRGQYWSSVAAGSTTISGVSSIQAFLPRFLPGDTTKLNYNYSIIINAGSTGFTAYAVGKTGSRVAGDNFTIDHNNNRNW